LRRSNAVGPDQEELALLSGHRELIRFPLSAGVAHLLRSSSSPRPLLIDQIPRARSRAGDRVYVPAFVGFYSASASRLPDLIFRGQEATVTTAAVARSRFSRSAAGRRSQRDQRADGRAENQGGSAVRCARLVGMAWVPVHFLAVPGSRSRHCPVETLKRRLDGPSRWGQQITGTSRSVARFPDRRPAGVILIWSPGWRSGPPPPSSAQCVVIGALVPGDRDAGSRRPPVQLKA